MADKGSVPLMLLEDDRIPLCGLYRIGPLNFELILIDQVKGKAIIPKGHGVVFKGSTFVFKGRTFNITGHDAQLHFSPGLRTFQPLRQNRVLYFS